jgi:hypothetical protein
MLKVTSWLIADTYEYPLPGIEKIPATNTTSKPHRRIPLAIPLHLPATPWKGV